MSLKLSEKSGIKKILVISLTNIGDVILTFPVIDILKRDFPSAKISMVIGPKAKTLLQDNPYLDQIHIFDKRQPLWQMLKWIKALRENRFDLVVDLRNTAIPLMVNTRWRTSCRMTKKHPGHMREKHLQQLHSVYEFTPLPVQRYCVFNTAKNEEYVEQMVRRDIGDQGKLVAVAPGAADQAKRWPARHFARVCDFLITHHGMTVVLVGSGEDRVIAEGVSALTESQPVNWCGKMDLAQLAALIKQCQLVVTNDSAPMHLASYLDIPVLALFGPTDPRLYGPWSRESLYLREHRSCRACALPKASLTHTCLEAINSERVTTLIGMDDRTGKVRLIR